MKPMLVSERSQTTACGLSLAGIAGSNPTGGMDVSCECCVLSSRGLSYNLSLVQRSPTYFGVSVCVRYKPHKRGGHGPLWAVAPEGENVCPKGRQHTKVHDILTQEKKKLLVFFALKMPYLVCLYLAFCLCVS